MEAKVIEKYMANTKQKISLPVKKMFTHFKKMLTWKLFFIKCSWLWKNHSWFLKNCSRHNFFIKLKKVHWFKNYDHSFIKICSPGFKKHVHGFQKMSMVPKILFAAQLFSSDQNSCSTVQKNFTHFQKKCSPGF
jgi:hypothetical protein